jgi:hypothetical protein
MPPKYTVVPPRHNMDRKPPGSSQAARKMGRKQGLKPTAPAPKVAKRTYQGAKQPPSPNPKHRNTGGVWSKEVRAEADKVIRAKEPDVKAVIDAVDGLGVERPVHEARMPGKRVPYNKAWALMICGIVSTSATGVLAALRLLADEGVAHLNYNDIFQWQRDVPEFVRLLDEARQRQSDYLQDLAAHVAMTPMLGTVTKVVSKPDGTETTRIQSDNINRSRLIVDTIMRRSALLNPRWRDKSDGDKDGPNEQLQALIAALESPAVEE